MRITTDEYDDLVIKEKQLQKDLNMQMSDHTEADESFLINVSYLLDISNRATGLFEVSEVQQKRQLLNFLLSNCKLEGEKLLFELKQPFNALYNASKTQSWLPGSWFDRLTIASTRTIILPPAQNSLLFVLTSRNLEQSELPSLL